MGLSVRAGIAAYSDRVPASPPRLFPLWLATLLSVVAGLALTTAFPSLAWWPMAFPAVVLALATLVGRGVWGSVLCGLLFGLSFFLVNVSFTGRYLGPIPWIALSVLEAALVAIASIPISLAYRWMPRLLPGPWGRTLVLALVVAGLWTAREVLVGTFPYGGFPWARLGMTQADSPLARVSSWTGISGLTFLMVFVCAAALEVIRLRRRAVWAAIPAAVVAVVLFALPAFPTTANGTLRVGWVQGNGPAGYFDSRTADAVLDAQLKATAPIANERMDVLLWPEGGVDSDPTHHTATAAVLDAVSAQVQAPLLMNAATERGADVFNSSMMWLDGAGATQTYDKRHPVPFGEYVPDRDFFYALAPDLVGLIQRGYTPGTAAPVMSVAGTTVGLAICFDVIYDDVVHDAARDGASVYLLQTNNADFRGTDENLQQLAFARMRAIETGRAVVNLSTVGTSQVIAPDGSVIAGLAADEPGAAVTDVPLRTGLTPAVVIGDGVQVALVAGSLVALAGAGGVLLWRRRRYAKTPAPAGGTGVDVERG
ncbi:Apolipoprotein N-acyltransferase [Microbacterium ginsengisoli]|uniref:Apolipoprotein N-acyltransferase n=1 Tax=Microbacterium ginsengisoli TaxID=400772 RepID=A0A0F0LRN8_9MICO|nr:apolipoprotein N-acyltransferase [Microbacterium ginsengisoli]KJL35798.1 Apolipoprotein N-acyltransferase [Microbacterium ginsengisoli]MBN9208878.1 apolipoprotein N-acyltransferase [Microbacterium ginsengisoli]HAN23666.1 apolipoprotein N-acyltransferase [Microbacterium ginsengisoli]